MKKILNKFDISVESGFSDKLRIVTFFLAINKLKIKRNKILYFFDKETKGCPYKFKDNFNIKNCKIKNISMKPSSKFNLNPFNSEINLENCKLHNIYKEIDNKKLLNSWKESYIKITPNSRIKKKINIIKLPKKFISVHVRSTDRLISISNFFRQLQHKDMIFDLQLNTFKNKIANIIKSKTDIKNVFIASDDSQIKEELIYKLKKDNFNVYFNNNKFYSGKFRQTSGSDFSVDLVCLARSRIVFTTTGAGVTDSAYLMSGSKLKVFKWINQLNRYFLLRIFSLSIFYFKKIFQKLKKLFI
jgi:hypothetical protein